MFPFPLRLTTNFSGSAFQHQVNLWMEQFWICHPWICGGGDVKGVLDESKVLDLSLMGLQDLWFGWLWTSGIVPS